jgi:hypothetical protein
MRGHPMNAQAENRVCGWCGQPLSPDDRGLDHESCALAAPGRAVCLMCTRIIPGGHDAAAYIDLPDERAVGPLHQACIEPYRLLRRGAKP